MSGMAVNGVTADLLDALPVGAVLIARHRKYPDVATWTKTDDTELVNEYNDGPEETAWMSATYTSDRRAAELVAESSAMRIIWDGSEDLR